MFRTKKDVERHVQEMLRKVKNENERNMRCYNIALQFFKVRDYESAKHYLSLYLSVKENSPLAHKLQGQIYEGLGDKVRALNAYKTSLEYEGNQPDLVLKMCELLCETDVAMDPDRAQYWCERGASCFPHDPSVFRLKEKLLKFGGKASTQAFEELINSELKARPDDVAVRTRLMRLYMETGRTKEAFNHAVELEVSRTFKKELAWYECFAQVCECYAREFPTQVDWQMYCTWMSVLDKVSSISLSELSGHKKLVDCIQVIFSMDQVLFRAAKVVAPKEHSELYKQFIRHMTGQLCLHIATLILKRAKKEPSNWEDANRSASAVLFLAQSGPPDIDAPWCLALQPHLKQSLAQWAADAHYRVSQAGYTLLGLAKNAGPLFSENVMNITTGNWRERTIQRLFTLLDHRASLGTSHFVNSTLLSKVSVKLPVHDTGMLRTREIVPVYERVRDTLHHLVWLGIEVYKHNNSKLTPDFHTYGFTRLKLTTHNLSSTSPETLSLLDVDAFLYATVLCAAADQEQMVLNAFYPKHRPLTLPADISNLLCSQEQINWWKSACQVNWQQFSGNTNCVVLRQQLQRGLEVVRVEGNHGLDVQLIVKLARTFEDRAASLTSKSSEQSPLEERASLYWNAALPLLERLEKNQAVRLSDSKLFEYPRKELSAPEVSSLLEEGRYFVACQLMKSDQHERAIEAFKSLRSPYASFKQALIYKKLAAAELEDKAREEITSEMRSKHVILLSKARECLNLTWDRIRIDRRHALHDTLPDHILEVETALSRIEPDPDMVNRSDVEANMSGASVSSVGSPGAGDMGLQSHPSPRVNGRPHRHASTPRQNYNSHSGYRRHTNNGDLVDVGQLLQIQSLQDEMKKIHEKLEIIIDQMNEMRRDLNKAKPPGADDLYLFGDEEEYPEDVLGGQYPPTFVPSYPVSAQAAPTFYPPPTRGVQGTSTVTYGAPAPPQQPPVIPLIPMRVPIDPALAAYQAPQNLAFYNQGGFPLTDPHHLPDFLRPTIVKPVLLPPPPANVVITTSDTLPTGPPPVQPTLSVTIPPQHRLGTAPVSSTSTTTPPHKFQIPMPATATTPNMEKSPIVVPDEVDSEEDAEVSYDPCPDFRPIIPLPNEVSLTTGEEDDDILFENRSKLFRFVEKEWKERGVGIVKILKNRVTNKVRLLMRRDQVHKICANHLINSEMELTFLKNSDRALVWIANDFAEEVVQLEKFCIKFKTPEEANKFKDVFNDAKIKFGQSPQKPKDEKDVKPTKSLSAVTENKPLDSSAKVNVGGFTFTSPPKLKEPIEESAKIKDDHKKDATPSPFAAFTFKPQNVSATKASTVVFKPATLFAGLNSTQNKHTLFEEDKNDPLPEPSFSTKESSSGASTNISPKIVLKEPVLLEQSPSSVKNEKKDSNKNITVVKVTEPDQPKSFFNFTSQPSATKETPKSILKESPFNSPNSTTLSNKPSPAAKHVLFQDSVVSPSQQTPTLAALLTTPKTPVVDFAALSQMSENTTKPFGSENKSGGFEGAGSVVFGNQRVRQNSEGENAEEFVPSAEFKPVIPLPELVEVKTGEEGEEVLFNERAKLMRFDPDIKEWKERGLGQMKILKEPKTGVTRFLMRREQVHKVCCNHRIIQSMELKASSSSEKAWTWYAVDYSEGETRNELFAIRFKTVELAKKFKETVEASQKQLREEVTAKRSCPDSMAQEEVTSPNNVWKCQNCLFPNSTDARSCKACSKTKNEANALPKLSELFRPKAGSWECKACYTVNGAKDSTCVSCDSPKEKPKSPGPSPVTEKPAPPLAELFKPKAGSWECKACYTVNSAKDSKCVSCDSPKEKPKSPGPSPVAEKPAPSLAELFKPKAGSWECGGCLVRNNPGVTVCPACSTPRPGHEGDAKESQQKSSLSFGTSSFSFGVKPTDDKPTGFTFGIKPSGETPKTSFIFGSKSVSTTPNMPENNQVSKNLFPTKAELATPEKTLPVSSGGFTFGETSTPKAAFTFAPKSEIVMSSADSTDKSENKPAQATTFKFGSLAGDSTANASKASFMFGAPTPPNTAEDQFSFGNSATFEFSFSGVKTVRSPGGSRSPRSPSIGHETDSDPEEVDDEEADNIVFQPVVPLPDKVPVTTGEEDEEVLYTHRSKLYRFAQGEWKERGIGDIKLLRHNNTHKIRLLMRREPILKICLNHFLTAEMEFSPKDDKSWLWSAQDFSDGQVTNEQFCLRLKTPEIANDFKAAVESAQGELEAAKSEQAPAPVVLGDSAALVGSGDSAASETINDIEIVYEARVSEELRQAALKLQLPPNFYSYLDAPPCPGCPGCELDSEEESKKSLTTKPQVPSTITKTAVTSSPPVCTTVPQPFTFTVQTTTTSTTPSSVFGVSVSSSSPLFSTSASSQSKFSFSLNNPLTPNTNVFGSHSQPVSSGAASIFGVSNSQPLSSGPATIFGGSNSQPVSTVAASIFGGSPIFSSQPTTKTLFGGTPVFENTAKTPTNAQSMFGSSTTQSGATFSFGQNTFAAQNTPSLFSGASNQTPKGSPFFNSFSFSPASSPPQNFFGSQSPATAFGSPSPLVDSSSKGSSVFENTPKPSTLKNIFGGSSQKPAATMLGTATTNSGPSQTSIFGESHSSGELFGSGFTAKPDKTTDSGPTFLFRPTVTFSDIAATNKQPAFESGKENSTFSFSNAGAPLFSNQAVRPSQKDEESGGESGAEDSAADASHDPVFEPIVPLPAIIEVRTGEEEEDKEFCSRAKFFRYDTDLKEWKERGTGEMKILRHRKTKTYRLLLRRDQVHKVVCNQLILPEMELQPLANSDKAFCWAAMNFAEEYSEPQLEKVAVRFANSDIAAEFKEKLEECCAKVRSTKGLDVSEDFDPSGIMEPSVSIEEIGTEYSEGEEGEDYGEGEDMEPMFEKRATLYCRDEGDSWNKISQGELSIMYYSSINMGRIVFKKDGGEAVNIATGPESNVQRLSDKDVAWCGHDYNMESGEMQEYKAVFCTTQATEEFVAAFNDVMELSQTFDSSYVDSEPED